MGQAAQRAKRLSALQPLCAGPSQFEVGRDSVVLIARNFSDAKQKMIAAMADVLGRHVALNNLERAVTDCPGEVGWIVVSYSRDEGVLYQQLVNSGAAIEHLTNMLGEGYAARLRRWTTLVFGTQSDVETVRSLVSRFKEDVELSRPAPAPNIAVGHGIDQKILLEISRSDVDTMNLASALLFFDTFLTSIEAVNRMAGRVIVSFSGYDDDPRFVGQIPAVNAFLRQLFSFAPWAPLVLDTSSFFVVVTALDSRASITTLSNQKVRVEVSPEAATSIISGFTWSMAEFLGSRFFTTDIPASVRGTLLEWGAFLNSGPDPIAAPEWSM
jgi:hypothetical protein